MEINNGVKESLQVRVEWLVRAKKAGQLEAQLWPILFRSRKLTVTAKDGCLAPNELPLPPPYSSQTRRD
jgi:hypothetical protein